ncbi:unnamed protein product [Lymnaea stagnalis]|uniref:MRH domain-containing protein n=1 Tax=Lymnaea stagnalis TaxID=6523 RepID=A0AAV2HJJ3_LYMST
MSAYTILVILVSVASMALALDSCTVQRQCYCETKTNFVDLNLIGNITFNLTDSQGGSIYSIRLCQTLNLPYVACHSVHGCQYNVLSGQNYTIANASNPVFNDSTTLIYRGANRTTVVNLVCSTQQDNFTFSNEKPQLTYNFVLTGKSACPKDLPVSTTTTIVPSNTTASNTTTHANTTITTHPPTNSTTVTTTPKTSPTTTAKVTNATTTTTVTTKSSTPKTSITTPIASTTHKGAASTISFMTLWTVTFAVWLSSTLF